MYSIPRIITAIGFCCISIVCSAQFTRMNDDPDAAFKSAKELFQKEQYSLAYPVFKNLYTSDNSNSSIPVTIQSESKYYYVCCGLKINDAAIVPLAKNFIDLEHHAPHVEMAAFYLAEYYFRQKEFGNAISYYDKSGIENLSNSEIETMNFHKGYAHFALQQFNEARPLLDAVRQIPNNPDYIDANYYYGFIVFSEGKYKEALKAFNIANTAPDYQNIVPFYIAEIYYFQGEHEKALSYAEKAIKLGNQYYDLQLKQLAGHLYFDQKIYDRAEPYLEAWVSQADDVKREDLYELSYCYYAAGKWEKSINGFKQIGGKEDSLTQNSMYLLASAYLKTNQKASARNAFLFCESNNSNPTQKEISQFSYAKLSYELGYLDISLKEIKSFIDRYPGSNYLQEAKELEISILANTSNFKEAKILFESLPSQSEEVKKLYPGILYGRATELVNDQHLDQADEIYSKILKLPYNNNQVQLICFWKGEIAYRNGHLDEAISWFVNYLKNPQVNGEVNSRNGKYNLAYCLMKKENYGQALNYFLQVAGSQFNTSGTLEQDAYLRAADCYFMSKNYKQAQSMYQNVINMGGKSADYALYQEAIIAGAGNKVADKIAILKSLSTKFPGSSLIPDANMEIAGSYMADEKYDQAILALEPVLKDSNATAFWPQVYLKEGIAYFNLNKNDESLHYFTDLVAKYPDSQESDEAIDYIRNIFIAAQRPGDFINFMKQNGKPVSYTEEDSLTYHAAALRYEAKDFDNASIGLKDYLSKYSDGRYAVEANFFLAEILNNSKDTKAALPYYSAVADRAPNKYAERSALQAARTCYFDLKDYDKAESYFILLRKVASQQENKLEAMRGLLRCQYKLQHWKDAVTNARELLNEKGLATDDKMIAYLLLGKKEEADQHNDQALSYYKLVIQAGKSEYSAEAQYAVARILFEQGKYAESEKASFEVIRKYGSYDYWVTRSYLLLGDIYFKQNDLFNAEATYKSVSENATIEELKNEALQKWKMVTAEKEKNNKIDQQ